MLGLGDFMKLLFEKQRIRLYVIACAIALVFFSDGEGRCAAPEALAADGAGYRMVNGVAVMPILPGNETVVQGLLTSLAQDGDFQG
ncbi:MAG: hypothetical protein P4N59_16080, partial [Negativicutes bacterium]|nr:hypothetical protein [Negativicutes bacterium]